TFTGSTPVGKTLIKISADTVKNVTMELVGHAPLIIAKVPDLDYAVEQTIDSKFRIAVQSWECAIRFIFHEKFSKPFVEKLTEKLQQLTVGNGLKEDTDIGPIINEAGYEKIAAQITDAVEKGAEVLTGNKYNVDKDKGYYFVYPTVLNDVNENMDIM